MADDLSHVLVFSDGLEVNGSALVEGLTAVLPPGVGVTGGMAADGPRFGETVVVLDAVLPRGSAVANQRPWLAHPLYWPVTTGVRSPPFAARHGYVRISDEHLMPDQAAYDNTP